MKYCIRYINDFRLYDLVDEIKIKLWEVDMNLLGYTQKIKQEKLKQRIIVDLTVLTKCLPAPNSTFLTSSVTSQNLTICSYLSKVFFDFLY